MEELKREKIVKKDSLKNALQRSISKGEKKMCGGS